MKSDLNDRGVHNNTMVQVATTIKVITLTTGIGIREIGTTIRHPGQVDSIVATEKETPIVDQTEIGMTTAKAIGIKTMTIIGLVMDNIPGLMIREMCAKEITKEGRGV